ncbi:calpain-8-like [Crotalus tigris]|uniref:calpain-8-like n=1 Tax=Crotalus tigris TaxID=88082 RepID=UPI00192F8AEC|nr:calpain-8-like [Crotalus tigris]
MAVLTFSQEKLENQADAHLSREFFSTNKPVAHLAVKLREASSRFHLPQGEYLIVLYTYDPFKDGQFCLRIFSVKQFKALEIGHTVTANPYGPQVIGKDRDEFKSVFQKLSREECELTADELQTILNKVITKRTDIKSDRFNINTCREMIGLLDVSFKCHPSPLDFPCELLPRYAKIYTSHFCTLGFIEFKILWMKIQKYLEIYKKVATNYTGTIDAHEMRNALKEASFTLSNKIQQSIIIRYACSKLAIDFDGFVACMIRLECLFSMFQILDKDKDGRIQLSLTEKYGKTAKTIQNIENSSIG